MNERFNDVQPPGSHVAPGGDKTGSNKLEMLIWSDDDKKDRRVICAKRKICDVARV